MHEKHYFVLKIATLQRIFLQNITQIAQNGLHY